MDTLIDLMNHPYLTLKLGLGSDTKRNVDAVYPITLFFAFGIYLVYERYQQTHNSPIPFDVPTPQVSRRTVDQAFPALIIAALYRRRTPHGRASSCRTRTSKYTSRTRTSSR